MNTNIFDQELKSIGQSDVVTLLTGAGFTKKYDTFSNVRCMYEYNQANSRGERLTVEIHLNTDAGGRGSLPALWYKNGWTPQRLATWWGLETFVFDSEGACYMDYNPQTKIEGGRYVIDFDYIKPATLANLSSLLGETVRRFLACQA